MDLKHLLVFTRNMYTSNVYTFETWCPGLKFIHTLNCKRPVKKSHQVMQKLSVSLEFYGISHLLYKTSNLFYPCNISEGFVLVRVISVLKNNLWWGKWSGALQIWKRSRSGRRILILNYSFVIYRNFSWNSWQKNEDRIIVYKTLGKCQNYKIII